MNTHLALVKSLQANRATSKEQSANISDMDIIFSQALLFEAGGKTLKAFKSGVIGDILAGLVALSYAALEALSLQSGEIELGSFKGKPQYHLLAIMRLLSQSITDCASGRAEHYAMLYQICSHLATDFLNADFDKAFKVYHEWLKADQIFGGASDILPNLISANVPDLTDCLYE